MTDQREGQEPQTPTKQTQSNWVLRAVQKTKSYLQDRRTKNKQENSQDRSSRRTANATAWIALLTFAVLFVGVLQYKTFDRQLVVMLGQLDEARIEQRAWVGSPTASVAKPVKIEDGRATFVFDISFTNVGHTPTQGAAIAAVMVPLKKGSSEVDDWHQLQKSVCKIPSSLGADNYAITPEDKFAYVPHYRDLMLDIGPRDKFFGAVTGCIFYKILADDKIHRTGFIGTVVYKEPGNAIPIMDSPVPISDLKS